VVVKLIKEREREDYKVVMPEIAIDLGLNPLFA